MVRTAHTLKKKKKKKKIFVSVCMLVMTDRKSICGVRGVSVLSVWDYRVVIKEVARLGLS